MRLSSDVTQMSVFCLESVMVSENFSGIQSVDMLSRHII